MMRRRRLCIRGFTINKSLISNLIAAALGLLGLNLDGSYREYVLTIGLFALSGGITNWLAVHMLFERVPGIYGSGVIPLRFEEFKMGIRRLIIDQFFKPADLEAFFHGAGETAEELAEQLQQAIDDFDLDTAFESLLDVIMASSLGSMLGMVGGRAALDSLKSPFVANMRDFFRKEFSDSRFQAKIQEALQSTLDDAAIRAKLELMIDQRLDQMTPQMVKDIIQEMIRKHLGWLVLWGCVFGGTIGLVVTLFANY